MQSQALTTKQQRVLNFIKTYIKKTSQSPTLPEIAIDIGVRSKSTISEYLGALEKKGHIRRIAGAFRGIIVNEEDEGSVELPLVEIPLKGKVAAGAPIEVVENEEIIKVPRKLIPNPNRKYFALEVKGDSMVEDGIYDGEIVIVESQNYASNGDLAVVKDKDGNVTLKYYYKENNRFRLEPRNKEYKPIYLDYCEILGLLRGITSKNS